MPAPCQVLCWPGGCGEQELCPHWVCRGGHSPPGEALTALCTLSPGWPGLPEARGHLELCPEVCPAPNLPTGLQPLQPALPALSTGEEAPHWAHSSVAARPKDLVRCAVPLEGVETMVGSGRRFQSRRRIRHSETRALVTMLRNGIHRWGSGSSQRLSNFLKETKWWR